MHVWCVAVKKEAKVPSMLWSPSSNRPRKRSTSSWLLMDGSSKNCLILLLFFFTVLVNTNQVGCNYCLFVVCNTFGFLTIEFANHTIFFGSVTDIGTSWVWWWITEAADVWVNGTTRVSFKFQPEVHHITIPKTTILLSKMSNTHSVFGANVTHRLLTAQNSLCHYSRSCSSPGGESWCLDWLTFVQSEIQ